MTFNNHFEIFFRPFGYDDVLFFLKGRGYFIERLKCVFKKLLIAVCITDIISNNVCSSESFPVTFITRFNSMLYSLLVELRAFNVIEF